MTIPKLQLSNLVNSDHINLMEFTAKATEKYPYIGEVLPEPVASIKSAYERENDAYLKSNRSFLTKQVQEANSVRILRFREVNNALKTAELCTDKAKAEAAVFLLEIIKDYGGATKILGSRVDSLSGILTNMVEDFQSRFPEKVAAVGQTECVEELRVANEAYKSLRSDRTEEVSEQVKKAMRDARAVSDTVWRGLVDVTNWRYYFKRDELMLPFMKYMATEVDWYRTILGQKPGDTNANPDGGTEDDETVPPTDEPSEPGTGGNPPTNEPTTPPTTEPSTPGSGGNGGGQTGGSSGSTDSTEKYTVAWYLPNGNPIIWYELAPGETIPEAPQAPEGYYWHPYPSVMPNHDLDIIPEPIQG